MCKMNITEAIALCQLKLKRKVTKQDIANALGYSVQYIGRIKNKALTNPQIKKIEAAFNISLTDINRQEYFEIPYLKIDGLDSKRIKNKQITTCWLDRELIENEWKKDAKNLRIIKMLGDKMNAGEYPLRHDDTLLIDISQTDILNSGIYVFTTAKNEETMVFICGVTMQTDGNVRVYFKNSAVYKDRLLTPEELNKIKFTVRGRVVKNLSLTI